MAALLRAETSDYSRNMATASTDLSNDEAHWIARAQRADTVAFEALYRMHIDRIYGLCLRMTGNVSEAEDVPRRRLSKPGTSSTDSRDSAFSTWLHRIAVNAVLGRMRKSKREHDRITAVAEQAPAPVTTGTRVSCGIYRRLSTGCQKAHDTYSCCTRCTATATTKRPGCWASRQERARRSCIGQDDCSHSN